MMFMISAIIAIILLSFLLSIVATMYEAEKEKNRALEKNLFYYRLGYWGKSCEECKTHSNELIDHKEAVIQKLKERK